VFRKRESAPSEQGAVMETPPAPVAAEG
jgi:hypothetical protein